MQVRSCPSIKFLICDETKETFAHILTPYERSMHLEWLVGDVPFHVNFFVKMTYPFKNADFHSIFARSASAVTIKFNYHYGLSNEPKMRQHTLPLSLS